MAAAPEPEPELLSGEDSDEEADKPVVNPADEAGAAADPEPLL